MILYTAKQLNGNLKFVSVNIMACIIWILLVKRDNFTSVFIFFLQWYSNNSYHFNCPHGTIECYGNIVQACAIEVYHDQHNLYKYITCLMTTVNPQNISNATYPVKDVSYIVIY
jgi:hypothetical protein